VYIQVKWVQVDVLVGFHDIAKGLLILGPAKRISIEILEGPVGLLSEVGGVDYDRSVVGLNGEFRGESFVLMRVVCLGQPPHIIDVVGQVNGPLAVVFTYRSFRYRLHVNMDRFVAGKEHAARAVVDCRDCQERVRTKCLATCVILAVCRHASHVLLASGRSDIDLNVEVVVHGVAEQAQIEAAGDGYRARIHGCNEDAFLKAVEDGSSRVGLLRASGEAKVADRTAMLG